jgi:hypothetical protein
MVRMSLFTLPLLNLLSCFFYPIFFDFISLEKKEGALLGQRDFPISFRARVTAAQSPGRPFSPIMTHTHNNNSRVRNRLR